MRGIILNHLALAVDVVANVLVVFALATGWRAVVRSEAKAISKWEKYRELVGEYKGKEISEEDARVDPRMIPGHEFMGMRVNSAQLVAKDTELSIIRAAKPALTLPFLLGVVATVLGLVAALLNAVG
jgi:hypothetical protein